VSPPRPRGAALARQRVLGVAFLVVIAMLVSLTVALYQKAFTPVVHVTLQAGTVGNQLTKGADVKARGVLVGQVRAITSTGDGARLDLALDPARVASLPKDVSAQLLPKTLFGEKFVALQIAPGDGSRPLRDGDVIGQDRTTTALETEKAVNDLLPLLRSLKPADLSATLNALSTALRGRGDQLGSTFADTAAYLKRLNPSLPTLQQDFAGLADLANSTAAATPNLLTVLDNLSSSSRSLVQERASLDAFLAATNGFTASADSLLRANASRLVALARDSLPSLQVFAEQSPGYPCLFRSLTALEPTLEAGFGGRQPGLHITLELTQDNGGYTVDQKPVYADPGGTTCRGLDPAHPEVPMLLYYNPYDGYYDGQEVDPYTGKPPCTHTPCAEPPKGGPASQRRVLAEAFAPILRVPLNQVPDLAGLMLGPIAQGATLTVR
jgi:phospholipid/cholesterol/gamma-HCH transport system substrate-binding protein